MTGKYLMKESLMELLEANILYHLFLYAHTRSIAYKDTFYYIHQFLLATKYLLQMYGHSNGVYIWW